MKSTKIEVVRGSGNVFRDLGRETADIEQLKALLAAQIIKALDREKLTVRAAHSVTGFATADFSPSATRISQGSLPTGSCPFSTGSGRVWKLKSGFVLSNRCHTKRLEMR